MKLMLKDIRKDRGMSQQALADAIGVTKYVVGTWERGEVSLPLDKACTVAAALDCTLDQLAGRKDFEPKPKAKERYEYALISMKLDKMAKEIEQLKGEVEK